MVSQTFPLDRANEILDKEVLVEENVIGIKLNGSLGVGITVNPNSDVCISTVSQNATGDFRVNYIVDFFTEVPALSGIVEATGAGPHRFVNTYNESVTGFDVFIANNDGVQGNEDFSFTIKRLGNDKKVKTKIRDI